MPTQKNHPHRDTVIKGALAAVTREGGFLLDCPPNAHHPRNLPFSWSADRILFAWEPDGLLEITDADAGEDPLGRMARFLEAVDAGRHSIAVGYISYDLGGRLEPTAASKRPSDPMPLLHFRSYRNHYEYEPRSGRLFLCSGQGRMEADERQRRHIIAQRTPHADTRPTSDFTDAPSDFTRDEYMEAVAAAREYILAGDIFEVNLSQRFRAPFRGKSDELYLALRAHNPASYAACIACDDGAVLSSSPELFLRVADGRVTTRPIKGTIARAARPAEDDAAAQALWLSEKDHAELAMIIDLERNDLGRVCRFGSVKVTERARVETFARVHHLVSTVEGALKPETGLADLLRATFPGGSITGAPKVRAMQIIDELEPCRRGVYTGSVGCVFPGGRAEFNISIRTMLHRENEVWLQVGGAVTADSKPRAEYDETLAKVAGMTAALGLSGKNPAHNLT